jgi:hypothetical protein
MLSPIVNTDKQMSAAMLKALTLHETFCIMSKINSVNENSVKEFIASRFNRDLANEFSSDFLFNSQVV